MYPGAGFNVTPFDLFITQISDAHLTLTFII